MKKRTQKWQALTALFGIVGLSLIPNPAQASKEAGNGGGAWVCRDKDGPQSVRWAELVDLFEASKEFYLEVPKINEPVDQQIQLAELRIFQANPTFYQELKPHLELVRANWPKEGDSELQRIEDALYRRVPDRKYCPNGSIEYTQVANFTEDGRILVNNDILYKLPKTDQAAIEIHEAIYSLLRDKLKVTTSELARKMVGYVFSSQPPSSYGQLLDISPPKPAFALPLQVEYGDPNRLDWCGWKVTYHSQSEQILMLTPVANPFTGKNQHHCYEDKLVFYFKCGFYGDPQNYCRKIWGSTDDVEFVILDSANHFSYLRSNGVRFENYKGF